MGANGLKTIGEDAVRLEASLTVADLHEVIPGRELLVEPLSSHETLAEFLRSGGLGWGSARNGTLASTLLRVKTSRFEYGSEKMTLYNVGYPLQRLVEGNAAATAGTEFGEVRELTLRVVPRRKRRAFRLGDGLTGLRLPPEALDAFYANEGGAQLLGLDAPGAVVLFPESFAGAPETGELPGELWEKRFIADGLSEGKKLLRIHALRSHLPKLLELCPPGEAFLTLVTHLGFLVGISGSKESLAEIRSAVRGMPMARVLG